MEHLKKKKSFSWRDLLYKSLLFVGTVTLIVYFLPRDGKFNYQLISISLEVRAVDRYFRLSYL